MSWTWPNYIILTKYENDLLTGNLYEHFGLKVDAFDPLNFDKEYFPYLFIPGIL